MANLPLIDHPTNRPNFTVVEAGSLTLWFSYKTPVAFWTEETGIVVCENVWGTTTGKHLNAIDGGDKKSRLSRSAYLAKLEEVAGR